MFEKIAGMLGLENKQQDKKEDIEFKENIIKFVVDEFDKRQKERLPLELQWRLNIAFYDGNQNQTINDSTKNIEEIKKLYWWQEAESFNQIAPIVETRLAKLGRLRPIPKVRPATDSKDDISSSKISSKLLESTYYDQKMKEKQLSANVWSELTGTSIYKAMWNPQKGRLIGAMPRAMEGEGEPEKIHEGDVETIIISPFEIYPDSIWNENIADCKSLIHAKAYHKKDVKLNWGVDVEGKEVDVFTVKSDIAGGGLGYSGGGSKVGSQKKKDSVIVYEYWELPTDKHPQGRLIICTDDDLLFYGELPYICGEKDTYGFPFKAQKSILKPGCFYGKSIIERIIPLQRRYNSLKNRKAEYLNRASIGQIMCEEGSTDLDYLESDGAAPGAIIEYKRGFNPPRYMEFHSLPSTFEQEEQNVLQDFIRISGVSEISRDSSAPVGANSGVALQLLQENDETRLSLSASYITESNIEVGKFWLRMYKQFANAPRILRSVGKDNDVEVAEWESSTITSDDLYVEAHSQTVESTAQRRQMVFDLVNMGLFTDPTTGQLTKEGQIKIFEMIELGNWESFTEESELHQNRAERENKLMSQMQMMQPKNYDDDLLHIQKHNMFRLGAGYEELLQQMPQLEQLFEMHIQLHFQSMQMKASPMAQQTEGENNEI